MFEPENDLEWALIAATSDPAQRDGFATMLLDSEVYVALLVEAGSIVTAVDGGKHIAEKSSLTMAAVSYAGRDHLAFFTAPSRARAFCTTDHVVAPDRTRDLFARNPDVQYLLNPGSDYGKQFTAAEVRMMLEGRTEIGPQTIVVDQATDIILGRPQFPPIALLGALERELGAVKAVHAAWLMRALSPGDDSQSWMLGVEQTGDWHDVQNAVGRAVRGDVLQGCYLDVKAIDESPLSETLKSGIPVIQRKRSVLQRLFGRSHGK